MFFVNDCLGARFCLFMFFWLHFMFLWIVLMCLFLILSYELFDMFFVFFVVFFLYLFCVFCKLYFFNIKFMDFFQKTFQTNHLKTI